jgi:hypothetical protein
MKKEILTKKGIIVNVDLATYKNLKSEQNKYHANMRKKISLADVIMHYYEIGNTKADKSVFSGLRIIENREDEYDTENRKDVLEGDSKDDISKSMLALIESREEALKAKESQLIKREERIIEKLFERNDTVDYKLFNQFQADFARVNVELALLKDEFNAYKKGDNNLNLGNSFDKIEKSLAIIEQQTKKSTLESILPFATPLLVILGYFLMSKKLDDKMNIEGMQKQINTIFQKLNKKDQKIVTRVVEQTLDDIL